MNVAAAGKATCWKTTYGEERIQSMSQSLREYCIQHGRMELLAEWIPEKNQGVSPSEVTFGSKKKVWWRCEKGHEWQAEIQTRTRQQTGCPYCAGKKLAPGNDLASRRPDLLAQWHPTKNNDLLPSEVGVGSHCAAWWICEKGHEWLAAIHSRTMGSGCPICSNKKIMVGVNDFATTHPSIAAQWHPTKNGSLKPQDVVYGTIRKVWWVCEKGHEWEAQVVNRARGIGCPVCSGRLIVSGENDLASGNPLLATQWDYEKNGSLRPDQVSLFSNKRVWWKCSLGHQWQATVGSRTKSGNDCPICSGKVVLPGFNDLKSRMPEIAKEWHPTLNGRLTPEMITSGSSQRAWWQCPYGHVWKAVISSRTGPQKCGCPACAGKVNQAKKRYYDALERDSFFQKMKEEANSVSDDVWDPTNNARSLAGETYGHWTVLKKTETDLNGNRFWYCRCVCGKEKFVRERYLLKGLSQSCGCKAKKRFKDITGQQYGQLIAVAPLEKRAHGGSVIWRCRCACGNEVDVSSNDLQQGRKKSCGCVRYRRKTDKSQPE